MLGNVRSVILGLVLDVFFTIRPDNAYFAVVEVDLVVVDIANDHVQVCLITQDDIVEDLQAELGELDGPAAHLFDFLALFFGNTLGQTAGDGGAGMDLATTDDLNHSVAVLAHLDDLAADFQPNLVDDTQNVALSNRGIQAHDEVRSTQGIEVGGVVGAVEGAIE